MVIRSQILSLKRDVKKLISRKCFEGFEDDYYLVGMEPKNRILLTPDEPAPEKPIL